MHGGLFSEDDVRLDDLRKVDRNRQPPDSGVDLSDLQNVYNTAKKPFFTLHLMSTVVSSLAWL